MRIQATLCRSVECDEWHVKAIPLFILSTCFGLCEHGNHRPVALHQSIKRSCQGPVIILMRRLLRRLTKSARSLSRNYSVMFKGLLPVRISVWRKNKIISLHHHSHKTWQKLSDDMLICLRPFGQRPSVRRISTLCSFLDVCRKAVREKHVDCRSNIVSPSLFKLLEQWNDKLLINECLSMSKCLIVQSWIAFPLFLEKITESNQSLLKLCLCWEKVKRR